MCKHWLMCCREETRLFVYLLISSYKMSKKNLGMKKRKLKIRFAVLGGGGNQHTAQSMTELSGSKKEKEKPLADTSK